jgi:transposase
VRCGPNIKKYMFFSEIPKKNAKRIKKFPYFKNTKKYALFSCIQTEFEIFMFVFLCEKN